MPDTLQDKIAIITGASSGIGEATARALAGAGARVVLAARRGDRLEAVRAGIEGNGGTALVVTTDVTDRSAVEALAQQTLEAFGRIDILINNAGVMLLSPPASVGCRRPGSPTEQQSRSKSRPARPQHPSGRRIGRSRDALW